MIRFLVGFLLGLFGGAWLLAAFLGSSLTETTDTEAGYVTWRLPTPSTPAT